MSKLKSYVYSLILSVLVLVLGLLATACGSSSYSVVGTPIPGADAAAGGGVGFVVKAGGVSVIVNEVTAYEYSHPSTEGYASVVVDLQINNQSSSYVIPYNDIVLVDDLSNQYVPWINRDGLPEIKTADPGNSTSGFLSFNVPRPALNNDLRLRCEPIGRSVRIEIFFDPISPETSPTPKSQG